MSRDELPALRALRGELVRGERLRLRAPDGKVAAAVVVFHDITDMSELERRRRDLFAMASHDLRTPLTTILAVAQVARRAVLKEPDRAAKALDDIERESKRMIWLVRDLLDVARFETGVIPVVLADGDLAMAARNAVERQPERARFTVSVPAGVGSASFDADRVDQVLDNLLSNAIRHTAPGTTVEVRIAQEKDEVIVSV